MLDITVEFRKGILFVRLSGILTKKTVKKLDKEVTDLVRLLEVRNLVFNLKNVNSIDYDGIKALLYNYELTRTNEGQSLICNVDNSLVKHRLRNSNILNYMYEASDELSAINVLDL